jgi:hypothetical protein
MQGESMVKYIAYVSQKLQVAIRKLLNGTGADIMK